MKFAAFASGLALGLAAALVPAHAAGDAPSLRLELNAAESSDKGCRLTFVVTNNLGADLERAAFELALFNDQGVVDRLTVLEFTAMPNGKTKVSRFDLAGGDCSKLSRVLVNDSTECNGAGVDPKACMKHLETVSKGSVAFGV